MTGTGIRQLAIGSGMALALAGCVAGTDKAVTANGDPAAAALAAEDISTTSLDGGATAAAPTAAAAGSAAPATTGPAATTPALATADAPPAAAAASQTAEATASAPATRERKGLFAFLKAKPKAAEAGTAEGLATTQAAATGAEPAAPATARNSVRMVDRDVEAPDVISVTESGLWDGRPSLGGVWVAYADVKDPERVIIRNTANGSFVIGALFRRERENPGPKLQVSSDAAAALGMLAGAPAKLNVTALRREEVVDPADAEALLGTDSPIQSEPIAGEAVAAIAATAPGKPAAKPTAKPAAAQAAEAAAPAGDLSAAAPKAEPAPVKTPAKAAAPAKAVGKGYLQVGIFSVEQNANNTATSMKTNGLSAKVVKESSQGKTFWRVIVGPAASAAEKDALKAKAAKLGFADAYFVSG